MRMLTQFATTAQGTRFGHRAVVFAISSLLVLLGPLSGVKLQAVHAAGKPNPKVLAPSISIALEPLGYQPMPTRFVPAGATMFTVAFADNEHLLVTFNTRTLLRRGADEPADDDDRSLAAVLLELPTGKVLARTVWHTHDRGQYLWPIGNGHFLLRIRNTLSVIAPVEHLAGGDAFHQDHFMDMKRRIGFIYVSPGKDVLGIETVPQPEPPLFGAAASAAALARVSPDAPKPEPRKPRPTEDSAVQVTFFRLHMETRQGVPVLVAAQSGFIRADGLIHIAATGRGNLRVSREGTTGYGFDFETHGGTKLPLGLFDTTCPPRVFWVSDSEFVAFGCLGTPDKRSLSEFDLRGQEPWIAALPGTLYAPYIVPAPAAGRFAYSHILVNAASFNEENVSAADLTGQEITVYQNHDGRRLLITQASPVQSAGQNFDLSPNGESLVVLHDGRIEVTRLPGLTGKDERELKLAREAVPAADGSPILLSSVPVANSQKKTPTVTVDTHQSADAAVVGDESRTSPAEIIERGGKVPASAADASVVGDVPVNGPRTPPTLYDPEHPKKPD